MEKLVIKYEISIKFELILSYYYDILPVYYKLFLLNNK